MTGGKYASQAEHWTEEAYADPRRYLQRRAALVVTLGPRLEPPDRVLDLACGDGGLGVHLLAHGLEYLGVDLTPEMVEAARRRLRDHAHIARADLNLYEPAAPVAATTCFRAIYYARDRLAFFRRVESYTEKKLLFDLNPRQYPVNAVREDLRRAGFPRFEARPFFVPQTQAPPRIVAAALGAAERFEPLARAVLRMRFTYVCAASRA